MKVSTRSESASALGLRPQERFLNEPDDGLEQHLARKSVASYERARQCRMLPIERQSNRPMVCIEVAQKNAAGDEGVMERDLAVVPGVHERQLVITRAQDRERCLPDL